VESESESESRRQKVVSGGQYLWLGLIEWFNVANKWTVERNVRFIRNARPAWIQILYTATDTFGDYSQDGCLILARSSSHAQMTFNVSNKGYSHPFLSPFVSSSPQPRKYSSVWVNVSGTDSDCHHHPLSRLGRQSFMWNWYPFEGRHHEMSLQKGVLCVSVCVSLGMCVCVRMCVRVRT